MRAFALTLALVCFPRSSWADECELLIARTVVETDVSFEGLDQEMIEFSRLVLS
jgi:hypothetical protein